MNMIDALIQTASLYNQVTLKDTAVAITDRTHYLHYVPGERLNHKVRAGDLIPKGALVERAMQSKSRQIAVVGAEVFGFPYIGMALPIFADQGHEVVGCLFIGENTELQESIKAMTETITEHVGKVAENSQEISEQMQTLNGLQNELGKRMQEFIIALGAIEEFSKVIDGIARQTNMLGLNASIEAARIGELGRGFAVVAEEIGKLAKASQSSVTSIHQNAKSIQNTSGSIVKDMGQIENISVEIEKMLKAVAEHVEGVNAMVQELNSMTQI